MKRRVWQMLVSCLALGGFVSSPAIADVILKAGKVVKVGKGVVVKSGKIQIEDCFTGEVSEYVQGLYQYQKGDDCKSSPAKKKLTKKSEALPPDIQPAK